MALTSKSALAVSVSQLNQCATIDANQRANTDHPVINRQN